MKSKEITEYVKMTADVLGGEFNVSTKGVPRIIMTGESCRISLVYVAKSNIWKAFYPYPASVQKKTYFSTSEEMMKFLREKGCFTK